MYEAETIETMWRQVTSDVKRRKLSGSYTKIKAYFFLGSARIFLGFGSTKKSASTRLNYFVAQLLRLRLTGLSWAVTSTIYTCHPVHLTCSS